MKYFLKKKWILLIVITPFVFSFFPHLIGNNGFVAVGAASVEAQTQPQTTNTFWDPLTFFDNQNVDAGAKAAVTQAQADQTSFASWNSKIAADTAAGNTSAAALDQAQADISQADFNYQKALYQADTCYPLNCGVGLPSSGIQLNQGLVNSTAATLAAKQAYLSQLEGNTGASASQQATSKALGAAAQGNLDAAANQCDFVHWGNCVGVAVAWIALAFASLAGFLLGIVGSLFNWVVVITIFQFGAYFGNSVGLLTAWGILRDIGNILLLFGFIFMGIMMILDLDSFPAGKAIARLIIVAVLLNFSLFAAEAVIDVANVLSASIYNQAGNVGCTSADPGTCANTGIALQVFHASGLDGIFGQISTLPAILKGIGADPTHQMIVYIGIALFMTITLVVLLAASILLIIRAVVLVFVMVLAPLGFAAMAIPPLASLGARWQKLLISQAFFAPIYLLLLLVSLKIMSAITSAFTSNGNPSTLLAALSTPNTSFGTIFIVFALVIGFMVAALMSAKQLGAVGADYATSFATKTVRGTMLAPVRFAGTPLYNKVVGGGAAKLSSYQTKSDFSGKLARGINSFTAGGLQRGLGKVQESKFLGGPSYKDVRDVKKTTQHSKEVADLKGDIKKGLGAPDGSVAKNNMMKAVQKMAPDDLVKEINGMSKADREEIAKVIAPDKFNKMLEHKELEAGAKEQIVEGRYEEERHALAEYKTILARNRANNVTTSKADFDRVSKVFANLSAKEYEIMAANDASLLDDAATVINEDTSDGYGTSLIKDGVADKLLDSGVLNDDQKSKVKLSKKAEKLNYIADQIAAGQMTAQAGNATSYNIVKSMSKDLGKASKSVVTNTAIASEITQKLLASVVAENSIDKSADRQQILINIRNAHAAIRNNNNLPPAQRDAYQKEYDALKYYIQDNDAARTFFAGYNLP